MNSTRIKDLIQKQRSFFNSNVTLDISYRINALKKLYKTIESHSSLIEDALYNDLGKSSYESYMCEIGMTLSEINYMIKHLPSFARRKKVSSPLSVFPATSYTKASPYGVSLVMSPWNYPFQLSIIPLVDSIAAGNTVILKPSAYSPNTSKLLVTMISECFNEDYVAVVTGGRTENASLLEEKFDYICFTGSCSVGKEVMRKASEHLTPITLELGGKSPCIVEKTADIKLAAKRIVFGKYLNCGQTCVAPDYVYCDATIKDKLVNEIKQQIIQQYTDNPINNKNYGKIINEKLFNRLLGLIDKSKLIYGGRADSSTLKIEPTILDNVTFKDPVMQEEIFGPILPILTFDRIDTVNEKINSLPSPLAFYIFTNNIKLANDIISTCQFGGGCINDTILHLATSNMGFGGVGESGIGAYHGKTGFDTFSHYKSIVHKKSKLDFEFRYQPYLPLYENLLRKFFK